MYFQRIIVNHVLILLTYCGEEASSVLQIFI